MIYHTTLQLREDINRFSSWKTANVLPHGWAVIISGGHFLTVRAQLDWIKVGQEGRQADHQEGYFDDRYLENAIIYPQTLS